MEHAHIISNINQKIKYMLSHKDFPSGTIKQNFLMAGDSLTPKTMPKKNRISKGFQFDWSIGMIMVLMLICVGIVIAMFLG